MTKNESDVGRLAGIVAECFIGLQRDDSDVGGALHDIAADEVLSPIFRKALMHEFRHCSSGTRMCEGLSLMPYFDVEMSRRIVMRGIMQDFVMYLAQPGKEHLRKTCLSNLEDVRHALQEWFSEDEIAEREIRFREMLAEH